MRYLKTLPRRFKNGFREGAFQNTRRFFSAEKKSEKALEKAQEKQ